MNIRNHSGGSGLHETAQRILSALARLCSDNGLDRIAPVVAVAHGPEGMPVDDGLGGFGASAGLPGGNTCVLRGLLYVGGAA